MNTVVNPETNNNSPQISEFLNSPTSELRQPERPFDVLISKPHEEIIGFLEGCERLADTIREEQPDIIFVPLRGAVPFVETARLMVGAENIDTPLYVDLPLGERQTIEERKRKFKGESYQVRAFGPNKKTKEVLIGNIIDELQQSGSYIPNESKLMLIDEVQTGSTLETAAKSIATTIRGKGDTQPLVVVGMQDIRETDDEKKGLKRSKNLTLKYQEMLSDTEQNNDNLLNIETTAIGLPAFTVDVHAFLDDILWLQEDEGNPNSYEKIENTNAKRMLGVLVNVFGNPEEALQELLALRRMEISESLGDTLLQNEILENVTDPTPVRGRNAADAHNAIAWWIGLTKKMIIKKRGDEARLAS